LFYYLEKLPELDFAPSLRLNEIPLKTFARKVFENEKLRDRIMPFRYLTVSWVWFEKLIFVKPKLEEYCILDAFLH
jgi:hypothetical protein